MAEFKPSDLLAHQVPPPDGVPGGEEIFSRDSLKGAVPEDEGAAYMEAADAWVDANGGHR